MKTEREMTQQAERHSIQLFQRRYAHAAARRGMAGVLALTMLGLSTGPVWSQEAPPPPDGYDAGAPPQAYQSLGAEQLDDLVAPIALYPDSLVAQVLAASTYPQQVVSAEEMVQENANIPPSELADMANQQPWDPSVKSLVAFPQVLNDLNQNMTWTTDLGNAYYNQPQDVMSAVQEMRQRAYAAGTLRSTPQLAVDYDPGDIVIAPVSENVVYVPYYNPWVVYGAPLPVYAHYYWGPPPGVVFGAGLAIGFGVGFAIGAFGGFGWGFHSWAPNWHSGAVVYNHTTFISNSTTVINHGYYGQFSHNPQAVAFNRGQAAAFGHRPMPYNPGGPMQNHPQPYNPGGPMQKHPQPYNPGGPMQNHPQPYNPGGPMQNHPQPYNPGGPVQNHPQPYNPGGPIQNHGTQPYNPGGPMQNRPQFSNGGAYNSRPAYQPNAAKRGAYNTRSAQNSHPQPQQRRSAPRPAPRPHVSHDNR